MQFNQTWHFGRLIELSLELSNDGWQMPKPLPQFELKEFDMRPYCAKTGQKDLSYTQEVTMCVQTGTYLETGAHMYPGEMPDISQIGLDRLFLSAVVLRIPKRRHEMITAAEMQAALNRALTASDATATAGAKPRHGDGGVDSIAPGDAILVDTGFDIRLNRNDLFASPHFSHGAIEWVIRQGASLLGSDASNWYDGKEQPGFFPMFMRSGVLLLAPMVNLGQLPESRIKLIVVPLPFKGACASPARVIGVLPE